MRRQSAYSSHPWPVNVMGTFFGGIDFSLPQPLPSSPFLHLSCEHADKLSTNHNNRHYYCLYTGHHSHQVPSPHPLASNATKQPTEHAAGRYHWIRAGAWASLPRSRDTSIWTHNRHFPLCTRLCHRDGIIGPTSASFQGIRFKDICRNSSSMDFPILSSFSTLSSSLPITPHSSISSPARSIPWSLSIETLKRRHRRFQNSAPGLEHGMEGWIPALCRSGGSATVQCQTAAMHLRNVGFEATRTGNFHSNEATPFTQHSKSFVHGAAWWE